MAKACYECLPKFNEINKANTAIVIVSGCYSAVYVGKGCLCSATNRLWQKPVMNACLNSMRSIRQTLLL